MDLNGKPVNDGNQLVGTVTATPIGQSLDVGVLRDGSHKDFKVTVADLTQVFPEQFGSATDQSQNPEGATAATFGMEITPLNDRQRETLGIKEQGGIQVRSVEPDSFAEDMGLQAGDILMSLNKQPINSTDDLQKLKSSLKPGDAVAFRVLRREHRNSGAWVPSYVAGTVPSR